MLCRNFTTHPGHKHAFPLDRLPPFLADMAALAEAVYEADADTSTRDGGKKSQRTILMDIKETEDAVEVRADIPGVQKEEINVDMEKDLLTLRVDHVEKIEEEHTGGDGDQKKTEGSGTTWHRSERSRVFIKRSIHLPEAADTSAAKATYENGVLVIHFPKKPLVDTTTKLTIN